VQTGALKESSEHGGPLHDELCRSPTVVERIAAQGIGSPFREANARLLASGTTQIDIALRAAKASLRPLR